MNLGKTKSAFDQYGYSDVNGVQNYGVFKYDVKNKVNDFIGYGRYIAIEQVNRDIDGGERVITIGYDDIYGQHETIDVDRECLGKKGELQSRLLALGADVVGPSINVLLGCLRQSEQTADQGECYHRTGWLFDKYVDDDGEPCIDQQFKGSFLIAKDVQPHEIRYVGAYDLCKKGTFSDWKAMILEWVIGTTPLEVAVLIGLSAIISSGWGARNLIFHLMGDSGKGKTTSAILAISVAGCPNPTETASRVNFKGKPMRSLLSSWRGTANALTAKLDGLDGTLMVFDELSKLEDTRVLHSTIYTISDGADKDRMESATELLRTGMFRTNVLSLGEESLIKKVPVKNTGINVRVCELSGEFTTSPEQSEAIVQGCYENYGHAAVRFARYIVEHLSYEVVAQIREHNLDEYTEALVAAGCPSDTPRRLAEFGAILLTVADIAEEALGIQFSREKVKNYLVNQQTSTDQNQDIGLRAHEALRGFVNTYIANFVTDGEVNWGKSIPCYGRVDVLKDGVTREVSIETSEFPKIMERLGFNNADLVIQRLKAHGLLNSEAKKNYRKRTITKATGIVRAYVVILP